jgi:spore coat protein JC
VKSGELDGELGASMRYLSQKYLMPTGLAKGEPIANLVEDMAAEQKARATYEHILNLSDDPCVNDTIKFLREREVVHFQRFGEVLDNVQTWMNKKKCY